MGNSPRIPRHKDVNTATSDLMGLIAERHSTSSYELAFRWVPDYFSHQRRRRPPGALFVAFHSLLLPITHGTPGLMVSLESSPTLVPPLLAM